MPNPDCREPLPDNCIAVPDIVTLGQYDDKINELELLKQAQGRLSQIDQYFLDTLNADRPNLVNKIHDEQCSICPYEVT